MNEKNEKCNSKDNKTDMMWYFRIQIKNSSFIPIESRYHAQLCIQHMN